MPTARPMTSSSSTWKAPFFCLNYGPTLCRHLNTDQPIYALHCLQTATEQELERMNSLEQMASFCLRDLRTVQRRGPYYLSGYCLHAIVAFDMGQRLMAQGEEVALLAMFDPPWLWLRMHQRLGLAWGKWKRRWRTMVSHSKAAPGLPEEVAHADGPAALRMRMFAAARSYVPEKYSGRMSCSSPVMVERRQPQRLPAGAAWRGVNSALIMLAARARRFSMNHMSMTLASSYDDACLRPQDYPKGIHRLMELDVTHEPRRQG